MWWWVGGKEQEKGIGERKREKEKENGEREEMSNDER